MGLPTLACGDRPHEVARTVCWAPHVMASEMASETASMTDSVTASASSAPQALSLPGGSRSQPPSFATRPPLSICSLSWVSLCRATLLTPSLQPLRNGDRPPHGPTAMGTRGSRPTGWRSAFCLQSGHPQLVRSHGSAGWLLPQSQVPMDRPGVPCSPAVSQATTS